MALIQSSVLTREGKKWKQRWAVLKKVSTKAAGHDTYWYLLLYKDASHERAGKEKLTLPLIDFCGMNVSQYYEKIENVLIIITLTQTMILSFDQKPVRNQWKHLLLEHFGESVTFDISIPDKQRLKPGQATIRLYPTFFSIIANKHYKCISRWFSNDILRYSAFDNSHFAFEIAAKSKGQIVNLLVPNNAYEIAKAFDYNTNRNNADNNGSLIHADFHGSAILDELNQAKRNVGDQNFFQRVILRASNHMKRKKRDKGQNTPVRKLPEHFNSHSFNDESKFYSLDRRKNPDLNIVLNEESMLKAMKLSRCQTHPVTSEAPPPLPYKNSQTHLESSSCEDSDKKDFINIDLNVEEKNLNFSKNIGSSSGDMIMKQKSGSQNENEKPDISENLKRETDLSDNVTKITDRSDTSNSLQRKSIECATAYKQASRGSIGKIRKTSIKRNESKQMPTPPPRSPVSLGIEPTTVFSFPSNENLDKTTDNLDNFELDVNVADNNLTQANDSSTFIKSDNLTLSVGCEPVYGNVESLKGSKENLFSVNNDKTIPRRKIIQNTPIKHLSDPLIVDTWKNATGDGQYPIVDYVNVKGRQANSLNDSFDDDIHDKNVKVIRKHHSDDDSDSYVNVSSDQVYSSKLMKLKPMHLKNYKNEFEKYDDEDPSIYHAVKALNEERLSHSSDAVTHGDGSYENINKTRAKQSSDYLNLMSPKTKIQNNTSLNYIMVTGKDPYRGNYKSNTTSPVHCSPKPHVEIYERSDYTRIDENMTGALNRSMLEHQQQRDKNKTPLKVSK